MKICNFLALNFFKSKQEVGRQALYERNFQEIDPEGGFLQKKVKVNILAIVR